MFGSFPSLSSKVHFNESRLYLFLLSQEMSFSFQRFFFFFSPSVQPTPPAPLELIKGRKRVFIPPGQRDAALRGKEGASPAHPGFPIRGLPAASLRLHPPASPGRPRCVPIAEPPGALGVCLDTQAASEPCPAHASLPLSSPTGCRRLEATGFGMGISTTFMPWHFLVSVGCQGFLGYAVAALMVCGGTVPWSGVLPVPLSVDSHCSALTPGDKECAGTPR